MTVRVIDEKGIVFGGRGESGEVKCIDSGGVRVLNDVYMAEVVVTVVVHLLIMQICSKFQEDELYHWFNQNCSLLENYG